MRSDEMKASSYVSLLYPELRLSGGEAGAGDASTSDYMYSKDPVTDDYIHSSIHKSA